MRQYQSQLIQTQAQLLVVKEKLTACELQNTKLSDQVKKVKESKAKRVMQMKSEQNRLVQENMQAL